jgi:hypothetical protein
MGGERFWLILCLAEVGKTLQKNISQAVVLHFLPKAFMHSSTRYFGELISGRLEE